MVGGHRFSYLILFPLASSARWNFGKSEPFARVLERLRTLSEVASFSQEQQSLHAEGAVNLKRCASIAASKLS
jgi:hypothetical protein